MNESTKKEREKAKRNESRHTRNNKKQKKEEDGIKGIKHWIRIKGKKVQQQPQAKNWHNTQRTALCLPRFLSIMLYRFVLSSPFDNKSSAFETVFLSSFHRSIRLDGWLVGWLVMRSRTRTQAHHSNFTLFFLSLTTSHQYQMILKSMWTWWLRQFTFNFKALLLDKVLPACFTLHMKFSFLFKERKENKIYTQSNTKR